VAVQVGAASTMAREQGFEDRLREAYPGITIVDKRYGDADVAKSLRAAENMLTAHPDVTGIFASNESSTVGAAQALKQRQMGVKLVGFDAGPVLEAELKSGVIDSLVVQHPFKMGYDAVTSAVRKLRNEEVTKIQNLEPRLVVRQDLTNPEVQAQLNPDLKQYLE
jgi:ribose transport system substrate-binding protein